MLLLSKVEISSLGEILPFCKMLLKQAQYCVEIDIFIWNIPSLEINTLSGSMNGHIWYTARKLIVLFEIYWVEKSALYTVVWRAIINYNSCAKKFTTVLVGKNLFLIN